jgi:CheY-like chemotaxis protein
MNRTELYGILRAISLEKSNTDDAFRELPEAPPWQATLEELRIDMFTAQEYFQSLGNRIPSKRFTVPAGLIDKLQMFPNLGSLCDYIVANGFEKNRNVEVVYVDDEPENLFVFKRRFGKRLNLKTFENPKDALGYIIGSPQVGLVITDEVMPELSGNQLCDEVHKAKPNMKFILITGNPNNDADLMYRSLRQNRFYEFINKPMDLDGKGEEYLNMINGLLAFDW